MVTHKVSSRTPKNWPWWRHVLAGLNVIALVLSVILSWHYLEGGSMAGCGAGSPCEKILDSRWSEIAGIIPVSALSVGAYLAMLFAGFFTGPAKEPSIRRMAWSLMLLLAGSISGSALWFIVVQKWFIGDFCPYCMSVHITGLILSGLIIWRAVQATIKRDHRDAEKHLFRPLHVTGPVLAGLVLAGCMAVSQAAFTPKSVFYGGESQHDLPSIDTGSAPIMGSPDAPYIVTLLFDYQCPHCQKLHFLLHEAVRRYAGKLAFVLCPTPLSAGCNPYIPPDMHAYDNSCDLARTGLAVWIADRKAYPVFDEWMFSFESGNSWHPRSVESARAKAIELVGREAFDAAWNDPRIGRYLKTCTEIFGRTLRNGRGGVPRLVYDQRWVVPEPDDADNLVKILQHSLSVPAP